MRITDDLHRAVRALRAIVDRLRRRSIAWLEAGLGLAACERGGQRLEMPPPEVAVSAPREVRPAPAPAPVSEVPIARFQMTFYFIIHEAEMEAPRPANDNTSDEVSLAAIGAAPAPELVPLKDQACVPLAHVTKAFAGQVMMQGTGKLRDGRMVNVATRCKCGRPCFHLVSPQRQWGTGGSGRALVPFRSVAVDPAVVKMGSLLYIPALDGMRMPGPAGVGGFVHDGCVVAVDTGGGIDGHQLDLFVGRRAYYKAMSKRGGSHSWSKSIEVWHGEGRCEQKGGKVRRSAAGSI
ncbi:MAG: hypothetical protein IPL61_05195 [Myxococcales bacterium]|nr:hypothetical protein [Myxococcales bacterium]